MELAKAGAECTGYSLTSILMSPCKSSAGFNFTQDMLTPICPLKGQIEHITLKQTSSNHKPTKLYKHKNYFQSGEQKLKSNTSSANSWHNHLVHVGTRDITPHFVDTRKKSTVEDTYAVFPLSQLFCGHFMKHKHSKSGVNPVATQSHIGSTQPSVVVGKAEKCPQRKNPCRHSGWCWLCALYATSRKRKLRSLVIVIL